MTIKIKAYGTRGSLPTPSRKGRNGEPDFDTTEYGGNTSAYHVQAGPFSLILDMGSGIANMGADMLKDGRALGGSHIVLISHYHWDHIQGGPFFVPFFIQGNSFYFHGFAPAGMEIHTPFDLVVEKLLAEQQVSPHFPVAHGSLPAKKHYNTHQRQFSETFYYTFNRGGGISPAKEDDFIWSKKSDFHLENWIKITTIPLNHPDGCLGYRIEYMGKVIVYATDNEPLRHPNVQLVKGAAGASWILLDGQYDEGRLKGMAQTFGHGSPRACVDQVRVTEMAPDGLLVIHHHDPAHDDTKLREIEKDTKAYATNVGACRTVFAREGDEWTIK